MIFKSLFNAISFILVSILLTPVICFGEPGSVNRQAYVTAAYEEFHSLLYFLSGSDRFLFELTPEERSQFELVGHSVVKHVIRLGPGAKPGQDRTSTRVDFKLQFSSRSEDFVLHAGEPERTAKMAGDIWFNLNIINNPKVSFGLLDAFQIMFHEFGHKIGEQKNQKVIDSVAAKIRVYLGSYYKENLLGPNTKVSSLVLPYISYEGNPVDFQFEPILIVDHQGQAACARLEVIPNHRSAVSFIGNSRSQAYDRFVLTPNISFDQKRIRIEWKIAIRHNFVVADRFNYIDLYTNLEKVKPYEKVEPLIENQKLIQYITGEHLQGVANKEYIAKPLPLKSINTEYHSYLPANENSRWLEKLKLSGEKDDRMEYSTVIETAKALHTALLLAEIDDSFLKFKGKVTSLGGNVYRLTFSLPTKSAYDKSLSLYAIALNNEELWDLEEIEKITLKKTTEPRSASPSHIAVLGKDQWHFVQEIQNSSLDTEEIHWRFRFKDTQTKIEQIEIMWLVFEDIYKDGVSYGGRNRNIFEVIDQKDMKQTWVDGALIVDVNATQASKIFQSHVNREGFTIKDSLYRGMLQLQITDQNYNVFLTGTRLVQTGWKSLFSIKPKETSNVNSCVGVFK